MLEGIYADILRFFGQYLGLLPILALLFKRKNIGAWWLLLGYFTLDFVTGLILSHLSSKGIDNWFVIDIANPFRWLLFGGFVVLLNRKVKGLVWFWLSALVLLITIAIFKPPTARWSLPLEAAIYMVLCGALMLRYIKAERMQELKTNGPFWIISAQFLFKSISLIILLIFGFVHLPKSEPWTLIIIQVWQFTVLGVELLHTYGAWNFKNYHSLER